MSFIKHDYNKSFSCLFANNNHNYNGLKAYTKTDIKTFYFNKGLLWIVKCRVKLLFCVKCLSQKEHE